MPHPTLIGGNNPEVIGAGILEIRGGKLYFVDNGSGHFKPLDSSLEKIEKIFRDKLPEKAFGKNFQGFLTYEQSAPLINLNKFKNKK